MLMNSSIKVKRTTDNIFQIKGMRFEQWPYWWCNGKTEQTNTTPWFRWRWGTSHVCSCVCSSLLADITPGLGAMSKVWHQNNGYSVAPLISHFSWSSIPLGNDWKWACITERVWQHLEQQEARWKMATCYGGSTKTIGWVVLFYCCTEYCHYKTVSQILRE